MSNLSTVKLLNVPYKNDYKDTAYFESTSAQTTYFTSKKFKEANNLSYIRKDNVIRYPLHIDELENNCNYVMYQNEEYSEKWHYAFITKFEYVNDGVTNIHIETDVLQTYIFDYVVLPSFVEREHVEDDKPGLHIIDESLHLSEYTCNIHSKAGLSDDRMVIAVGVTEYYDGDGWFPTKTLKYNGIDSSIRYYGFDSTAEGTGLLDDFIKTYAEAGKSDAIVCMFYVPRKLANVDDNGDVYFIDSTLYKCGVNQYDTATSINELITIKTNSVNGYTPRNKKLLCYPYKYLLVNNNNGSSVQYNYEDFDLIVIGSSENPQPQFLIEGCMTPGCSIRMTPLNYKGVARNDIEGINLGKYPILNWVSDVYTNWLTQNGVNMGVTGASSIMSVGYGVATGNLIASAGGVMSIAHLLSENYKHSLVPAQAEGNINCGDVVTASRQNDFHFYDMNIKESCAEVIDEYFDIYGYKVNKFKQPNYNHMKYYWYTKTQEANITGALPNETLKKIKECYDNGITFWKDGNYQKYSLTVRENNRIVY